MRPLPTCRTAEVVSAPEFLGKLLHLGIALRIAAQAGRRDRRGTVDNGTCFDELCDLFKQPGRHGFRTRQNQQPVGCSARKDDPSVLHFGSFHQDVRRTSVEPVTLLVGQRAAAVQGTGRGTEDVRCAFGSQIEDIGDRHALAQQMANSGSRSGGNPSPSATRSGRGPSARRRAPWSCPGDIHRPAACGRRCDRRSG